MTNPLRRIAIAGFFGVVVISAGGQPSLALFTSSDTASAFASTGHWIEEDLPILSEPTVLDAPEPPLDDSSDNEEAPTASAPAGEVSEPVLVTPQPEVVVEPTPAAPAPLPAPSVPEVVVPDPVAIPEPVVDPVSEPSSEPVAVEVTPIIPQPEAIEVALPATPEEVSQETDPTLALVSETNPSLVSDDAEPLIP